MGLYPETATEKLPWQLQGQTRLSRHLHAPHDARRKRVMLALWNTRRAREQGWANRLHLCCQVGLVAQDAATGHVYPWLARCGSRLCPFCGRGRARRVARQLTLAIATFSEPKHLILTYRSNDRPLAEQVHTLRDAFKKLRRHPQWTNRVLSGVYAIELTRNPTTGLWHPHLHVLIDSKYFPQKLLARLWSDIIGDTAHPWIRQVDSRLTAAREISKYVGQLPSIDTWPEHAIVEYARAVHGTRMLQTFGKAYAPELPEPDEKPAEKPDTWTISIPQIVNAAAAGVAVATDLCRLMWSRWPMLRTFIDSRCPPLGVEGPLDTNPVLSCPVPPTLPDGRVGMLADPVKIKQLDDGLDLTFLLLRGMVEANVIDMTQYYRECPQP